MENRTAVLCALVNIAFSFDTTSLVVTKDVMLVGVKGDEDCAPEPTLAGDIHEPLGEGTGKVCNTVSFETLKVSS